MSRLLSYGASAAILLLSPALALADEAHTSGPFGGHMWGEGMWGGMIFGPILMIFFLVLFIAVIVMVVRWLAGSSRGANLPGSQTGGDARKILNERFARGEIDKDEFDERRRVLEI